MIDARLPVRSRDRGGERFSSRWLDRHCRAVFEHCRRGSVACHVDGTTQRSFLPRSWDHPVAGDGTTWRVVPGVLTTSVYGCLQVNRLGGSGDGVPGGGGD